MYDKCTKKNETRKKGSEKWRYSHCFTKKITNFALAKSACRFLLLQMWLTITRKTHIYYIYG